MTTVGSQPTNKLCSIEGCGRVFHARGWCRMHYVRWYVHGDPSVNLNPPHETQHGTYNEYQNYGCRCELCKAAMSEWQRDKQSAPCPSCGKPIYGRWRPDALCRACDVARRTTPLEKLHGTETGYGRGCKCRDCRDAAAAARRRRRKVNPGNREADNARRKRLYWESLTPLQRATSRLAKDVAA